MIVYHIILVVKYRRPLLQEYGQWVKKTMLEIAQQSDFNIKEIEVDIDHIHLMIDSVPKLSVSQIVRRLKQQNTKKIWDAFPGF